MSGRIVTVDEATEQLGANEQQEYFVAFARALEGFYPMSFDWPYFLEKPWKYAREYAAWMNHDCPNPGDDGFEALAEEVDAL